MESNLLTDQNMPGYAIVASATNADGTESSGTVQGVGIPASGTKCLFATWSSQFEPQGESQLTELRGIDQVQGRLVNPLPYEILKPVLFYHNWRTVCHRGCDRARRSRSLMKWSRKI